MPSWPGARRFRPSGRTSSPSACSRTTTADPRRSESPASCACFRRPRSLRSRPPSVIASGASGSCWSRAPGRGGSRSSRPRALLMDDRIVVFAAGSAVGVCSTLFRPALIALLPSLARTARELIAANGATSTIESLGTLLGPLGAGVLVAFADVGAVFAVGAAALLVSAGLLARVSVPGRVPAPAKRPESRSGRASRQSARSRARGCSSASSPRRRSYAGA